MVKLPIDADPCPPEFIEDRTQFLHDYAALLSLWSHFELALEVKIARLVGMKPVDASIVIGGLNFGSKPDMLYALLNQRGHDEVAAKISTVISHVRRNALVHGVAGSSQNDRTFAFFKREIGSTYQVKHLVFTADEFHAHFQKFRDLAGAALEAMQLTMDDLEEYGHAAGLLEPTPPRPQARPPRAKSGRTSANT